MSTKQVLSALSGGRLAFHLCVSEVQATDSTLFFKQQTWSNLLGKFSSLSRPPSFVCKVGIVIVPIYRRLDTQQVPNKHKQKLDQCRTKEWTWQRVRILFANDRKTYASDFQEWMAYIPMSRVMCSHWRSWMKRCLHGIRR